jgi:hypothetical protein
MTRDEMGSECRKLMARAAKNAQISGPQISCNIYEEFSRKGSNIHIDIERECTALRAPILYNGARLGIESLIAKIQKRKYSHIIYSASV